MKQWEYSMVAQPSPASIKEIIKTLNELGRKGWEVCGQDYGYWIMKRKLAEMECADEQETR